MKNREQMPQKLNIQIDDKEAEGIYSNFAIISHSNAEFIIDFTRILPGSPKAKVHSRIITTPQHAKMFLNALKDNIEKFEAKNGEIKIEGQNPSQFGFVQPDGNEKIN